MATGLFVLELRKSGVRDTAAQTDLLHALRYDATVTDVDALSGKVSLKGLSSFISELCVVPLSFSNTLSSFFPHLRRLLRIALYNRSRRFRWRFAGGVIPVRQGFLGRTGTTSYA